MICVTRSMVSREPRVFGCENGLKRVCQSKRESKSLMKSTVPMKQRLLQTRAVRTEANPIRRDENVGQIEKLLNNGEKEPETHGAPVRRFVDLHYQPLCSNLAEVRENIDAIDHEIVALLAERGRFVKDAARFKRNAFQVSAPQRQQEVIAKVTALAEHEGAYPEVVEAVYCAMMEGFIARQQQDHHAMVDLKFQSQN